MATLVLTGVDQLQDRLITTANRWQKDVHVPFARAALVLYASTKRRFQAGGPGWPPIHHRKGQPLRDTGRLMASITGRGTGSHYQEKHAGTEHSLEIGTNVVYANVHQFGLNGAQPVKAHTRVITQAFGRKIAPRSVSVRAHTRQTNIPARPFLLMDDADRADILRVFQEWYFKKA